MVFRPADVDGFVPSRRRNVAHIPIRCGNLAFDDTAVGEFDVVNREAAQIGNFFNRALGPVVRAQVFWFFFMQINVFRADADPDFMLVRNAQTVVDADVVFQAVTFDDREIGAVVNNDAVKKYWFRR